MMSAWQYLQVSGVVDDVMQPRAIADLGSARAVKARILKETAESGVPLEDRDVSVTVDNRLYTVKILWSFPVIIYQGEPVLAIPLSLTRSKQTAGAFYLPAGRALAPAIIRPPGSAPAHLPNRKDFPPPRASATRTVTPHHAEKPGQPTPCRKNSQTEKALHL